MQRIDLGPVGPAGVEARYWDSDGRRYVWMRGSDHWWDWLHHVLPGAAAREIDAAHTIRTRILDPEVREYIVGGHSLGGAIASILAGLLLDHGDAARCYLFGPKRAPQGHVHGVAYVRRGDIVPGLPPWRPRYQHVAHLGEWETPWKAHHPESYSYARRMVGLK